MKIRAELKEKMDVQTFGEGENKFSKRTLIFEETEPEVEYPNNIAIDFGGDKMLLANAVSVGGVYDVCYSVNTRKTDKWAVFNIVKGWKITEVKAPKEDEEEVLPF